MADFQLSVRLEDCAGAWRVARSPDKDFRVMTGTSFKKKTSRGCNSVEREDLRLLGIVIVGGDPVVNDSLSPR